MGDDKSLSTVDVDIAFGTESRRRGEQSSGGNGNTVDFDGFVRALLHLACRKFPKSSSEVDALDTLLVTHVFPYAMATGDAGAPGGDAPEVTKVFDLFAEDTAGIYAGYANPSGTMT